MLILQSSFSICWSHQRKLHSICQSDQLEQSSFLLITLCHSTAAIVLLASWKFLDEFWAFCHRIHSTGWWSLCLMLPGRSIRLQNGRLWCFDDWQQILRHRIIYLFSRPWTCHPSLLLWLVWSPRDHLLWFEPLSNCPLSECRWTQILRFHRLYLIV